MSGKVIGLTLNNGFAGSYSRQPDMSIQTRANVGSDNIQFGDCLYASGTGVKKADASFTAATFVGIAARQVQTQLTYNAQNAGGEYPPNAPVPVFQLGRINVYVTSGTPALYGDVYVFTAVGTGSEPIGSFGCASDAGKNVKLTNAQWGSTKDANGIAELVILNTINA